MNDIEQTGKMEYQKAKDYLNEYKAWCCANDVSVIWYSEESKLYANKRVNKYN